MVTSLASTPRVAGSNPVSSTSHRGKIREHHSTFVSTGVVVVVKVETQSDDWVEIVGSARRRVGTQEASEVGGSGSLDGTPDVRDRDSRRIQSYLEVREKRIGCDPFAHRDR